MLRSWVGVVCCCVFCLFVCLFVFVFVLLFFYYLCTALISAMKDVQNDGVRCCTLVEGAGCSSVDRVPAFEAVGRRIDPSQWTQLQFGLFSVPTSGPQLVYQRPWYVLFCLWISAYKRSLAAYRKE